MQENLLQYIWQFQLYNSKELKTFENESVEVIHQGKLNTDAGPDFFNAKIKIGDTTWVGNVEIHVNTSDWQKHKHSSNPAYDNVILHVVYVYDSDYPAIPTIELQSRIPNHLLEKYRNLMLAKETIPCTNLISQANKSLWPFWKQSLLVERIEHKVQPLKESLSALDNNWEQLSFQLIARSFGLLKNADSFTYLAQQLPVNILFKHKDNLEQLESLLFGVAGFLSQDSIDDDYFLGLQKEWQFLKTKYQLKEMPVVMWKFARMRPPSFPTNRIAQFAAFIYSMPNSFVAFIQLKRITEIKSQLKAKTSNYWLTHFRFGKLTQAKSSILGESTINTIILNSIIPLQFLYNQHHNLKDNSIALLESLPLEKNNIISKWKELKVGMKSAYDSQAMLHLFKNYCTQQQCLQCSIGLSILKKEKL